MAGHDFRGAVSRRQKNTLIYRESDVMREGLSAALLTVESNVVDLVTEECLSEGEMVKLELINEIQRFKTTVRAEVEHAVELRGEFRIHFKLLNRLNPHAVLTLRMQLRESNELWF